MLERLIEDTARSIGLPSGKIEQLSCLLMALIFDRRNGGFAGFSASFHRFGRQRMFASWSSTGPKQSIAFDEVSEIFGVPLVAAIGGKLGIGSVMTTRALCCLLPGLIEELTLESEAPSAIPDSFRGRCNGTIEWLHEIDSAGWVAWRSHGLNPLQDTCLSQPARILRNRNPSEISRMAPWLMGALGLLLVGLLLRA